MMIVPSSVLDTMNLGGLVALSATKGMKAPAATPASPPPNAQ